MGVVIEYAIKDAIELLLKTLLKVQFETLLKTPLKTPLRALLKTPLNMLLKTLRYFVFLYCVFILSSLPLLFLLKAYLSRAVLRESVNCVTVLEQSSCWKKRVLHNSHYFYGPYLNNLSTVPILLMHMARPYMDLYKGGLFSALLKD